MSLLRVRNPSQKFPCKYSSSYYWLEFQHMPRYEAELVEETTMADSDLSGSAWAGSKICEIQYRLKVPKSGAGKLIFPSCGPTTLIHRGGQPQRIATCMPGCPGNLGCRWVRGSWTCAQAPHCGWRVTVECGLFLTDHGMEEGSWDPALGRQDYTQVKAWSLECIHHCFIIFHLKIQMQRSIY